VIYQECRTTQQIEVAFNQLQSDLELDITDTLRKTRQNLLENFDEEVHEKLKINLQESKEYLSKYENWLWNITKFFLGDNGEFSSDEHSFSLKRNPFDGFTIHPGPYRIGKNIDEANIYRISHPLAQRIIEQCKDNQLPAAELLFDYTNSGKRISILDSLVGKSGWISARSLSITTLETEDHVILSGVLDNGDELDKEQCNRLFSILATEIATNLAVDSQISESLNKGFIQQRSEILEVIGLRNSAFFEVEIEKLDKWGEDKRNSLKVTLKELDEQIKDIKKQARLAPNLPDKLRLEKQRKDLENDRDIAWKEYDGAAKDIEANKDKLIDQIEKRLDQYSKEEVLFNIKWTIK